METVDATTDIQGFVQYISRLIMVMLEEEDEPSNQLKNALKHPQHLEAIQKFASDPQTKILFIQRCSSKGKILQYNCFIRALYNTLCWVLIDFTMNYSSIKQRNIKISLHICVDEGEEGAEGDDEKEISYNIATNVQFTSIKMNRYVLVILFKIKVLLKVSNLCSNLNKCWNKVYFLYIWILFLAHCFFFCSVLCIKRGIVIEADKSFASQIRSINLSDGSPYETLHAYISNAVAPFFKSFVKESGKIER